MRKHSESKPTVPTVCKAYTQFNILFNVWPCGDHTLMHLNPGSTSTKPCISFKLNKYGPVLFLVIVGAVLCLFFVFLCWASKEHCVRHFLWLCWYDGGREWQTRYNFRKVGKTSSSIWQHTLQIHTAQPTIQTRRNSPKPIAPPRGLEHFRCGDWIWKRCMC